MPIPRLRLGTHSTGEEQRVMEAIESLSGAPIYLHDSAVLTVQDVRARCTRLRAESGLEIGEITRGLKEMARELEVPVVCAAQLPRAVEQRPPAHTDAVRPARIRIHRTGC